MDSDKVESPPSTSTPPPPAPPMKTTSRLHFGYDSSDSFTISIIEDDTKEEYGMFVWPCAIILAEYVWQQRSQFSKATVVLELGSGTSLPGLVAAKLGANVILTDNLNRREVLDNMREICNLNNLRCMVRIKCYRELRFSSVGLWPRVFFADTSLSWGEWDASLFDLRPQVLLGADVLYDTTDFDDLFAMVAFLLQRSPGSVFITTYHNRSGHHLIEFMMVKWGLKCIKLLDGFSFMPPCKASCLQGNIQLAEIILDDYKFL